MGAEWAKAYKSGETFEIESTPKLRKDDSLVKEHKKVKKKRKKKATVKSTKERHEITSRASIHTESIIESEVEGSNFKSYLEEKEEADGEARYLSDVSFSLRSTGTPKKKITKNHWHSSDKFIGKTEKSKQEKEKSEY